MRSLLALVLVCLAATPALAQTRNLDVERFRPAPDRDGFLGIPGTRTPGEWQWNASLFTGYQLEPLTVSRVDEDGRTPILSHRVSAELVAQLGLFDRAAAVVYVPMVLYQRADNGPLGGPEIAAVALRDPYVGARVRILGEGATGEHTRNEGEGLGVQVGVTLPFGLEHNFAGEGNPQLDAMLLGDFHFLDFGLGAMVGYRHRFAEPVLLGVQFANELFFGVALKTPTILIANLSALVEVRVTTALDQEAFQDPSTAFEGELGARWAEGDFALTWAVGMGFNGGVGVPGVRGIFGVEFAPRVHDADRDGIDDATDRCPRLPEDPDEHEDTDGCPDPDNDGDLVPDEDDRCPQEASDFDHDADEDGCTDPAYDVDQDAIDDALDECPEEPEDRDDFEDADGCPDPDDDGDGVPDAQDRCRREAEDADGFEDEDGCPDYDDDGDEVVDAHDACPREAEDRDGNGDDNGCPDPDDDRDGVLDANDRCPEELETINGVEDGDGCADRGGRALWRAVGEAERGWEPELSGAIRFDAAGAIRAMSMPAVEQLALHLRARWGFRWEVAIAADDAARRDALSAALRERGLGEGQVEVVTDASLTGWTVAVRRDPEALAEVRACVMNGDNACVVRLLGARGIVPRSGARPERGPE